VGYVLGKMEENAAIPNGHITSISVLRSFRKQGLAQTLLRHAHTAMVHTFGAQFVMLHVREGNRAARSLYEDLLGFRLSEVEEGYYADGENGLSLRLDVSPDGNVVFPVAAGERVPEFDKKDSAEDESQKRLQAWKDAHGHAGKKKTETPAPAAEKKAEGGQKQEQGGAKNKKKKKGGKK